MAGSSSNRDLIRFQAGDADPIMDHSAKSSSIRDLTRHLSKSKNILDYLPDDYASEIVPLWMVQQYRDNPNPVGGSRDGMRSIPDERDLGVRHKRSRRPLESKFHRGSNEPPNDYSNTYSPFGTSIPEHLHEGFYGSVGSHFQMHPENYNLYREERSHPEEFDTILDDLEYDYDRKDNAYAFPTNKGKFGKRHKKR